MATLEITETVKGKCSAIHEGFQYRRLRITKDKEVTWLCLNERRENCRGTLKSKNGIVVSVTKHLCKPNFVEVEVKRRICNAKKRARTEDDKDISSIYREEMEPLVSKGYALVTDIPSFKSLKTSMYTARRRTREEREVKAEIQWDQLNEEGVQGLILGNKIIEGKTKKVYDLPDEPGNALILSKDRITSLDGARAHDLMGKAQISNDTACKVFEFLNDVGIKGHFIRRHSDTSFVGRQCAMVPIEWVTRRIATGSFLKRHPGVEEGHRFAPLKQETFYKDDANHDPQWSEEQLISAKLKVGDVVIGRSEVDIMTRTSACVFEVLERAWASVDCVLVDMKVEYGVDLETGEILLADIIDSDSWRLWPAGDKRLMKDKQVYRNLTTVTDEDLQVVKKNFEWVADKLAEFVKPVNGRVVVMMGSLADRPIGEKVRKEVEALGIHCELRISSAHKATERTLRIVAEYESDGVPTVFVAIAGRSNGLGPVISGNSTYPVINCPPLTPDWGSQDVWSSMRMPSGLGCTTVLAPEAAALAASQAIGLTNHSVWSRLRAKQLNTWTSLIHQDSMAGN